MMNGMMMTPSSMVMMCGLMFVALLSVIAVLGLSVYLIIRHLMRKSKVVDHPYMLLKERFVRGEITEEEFKQKRTILRQD